MTKYERQGRVIPRLDYDKVEGLFVAEGPLDMTQTLWSSTLTNALWSTCCDGERKLHVSSSESTDAFVSVPAMSQRCVGRLCMVVGICVCACVCAQFVCDGAGIASSTEAQATDKCYLKVRDFTKAVTHSSSKQDV